MSYSDYLDGLRDGINIGYKIGLKKGYELGSSDGYLSGYKDGYEDSEYGLPYRPKERLNEYKFNIPKIDLPKYKLPDYNLDPLPKYNPILPLKNKFEDNDYDNNDDFSLNNKFKPLYNFNPISPLRNKYEDDDYYNNDNLIPKYKPPRIDFINDDDNNWWIMGVKEGSIVPINLQCGCKQVTVTLLAGSQKIKCPQCGKVTDVRIKINTNDEVSLFEVY